MTRPGEEGGVEGGEGGGFLCWLNLGRLSLSLYSRAERLDKFC